MRHKKAFTLIELLVVIAIIALLMGILMPALNRARKQARAVACQARIKSWGMFFKLYTDDFDGKFNAGWGVGERTLWMNALRPYYKKDMAMLLCPSAKREIYNMSDMGTFKAWSRDVDLPEGGEYHYVGSYSINSWTNFMTADRGSRKKEWFWKKTQNVKNTSKVPLFADSTWMDAWPRPEDTPIQSPDGFNVGDQGTSGEMNHFCIARHNGKANFAFMDWSIRPVGLKELWTLKWHRMFDTKGPWTMAGNNGAIPNWPQWLQKYSDF